MRDLTIKKILLWSTCPSSALPIITLVSIFHLGELISIFITVPDFFFAVPQLIIKQIVHLYNRHPILLKETQYDEHGCASIWAVLLNFCVNLLYRVLQ